MTLINLLRYISLKRLKLHKAQTLMSLCGIALGVSAIVSIGIVNTSVVRSFENSINSIAGRASIQVTDGETGFPEALLERVQAIPGVEYAVPVIETTATLIGKENQSIMILGVDVLQDQQIRDYRVSDETAEIPDPLLFLAKPDSILLSRELAKRCGIGMDSAIELETVRGIRKLRVRGFLDPVGPAKALANSLAVMDIYAAQMAFGKDGRIDRIDVSVRREDGTDAVRKRIQAAFPAGYDVETPATRSGQIEGLLSNLKRNISSIGFLAICIGMYLIYNSVSISVVLRRKEIGILRALGTTRREIIALFLAETALLSIAGSILGIGLGVLFAKGAMEAVGRNIALTYQLVNTGETLLSITVDHILTGFTVGISTSILAALVPAFAASRVTPVSAIRSLPFSEEAFISKKKLALVSIVLLALSLGLFLIYGATRHSSQRFIAPLIFASEFSFLFGATLAIPTALRSGIFLFQRFIAPRFGAVSRLAGLNIRKNINRNAVAAGAVFLAISLFVFVSNLVFSMRQSVLHWGDTMYNSDLMITAGRPIMGHSRQNVPLPIEVRNEIEKLDGVRLTDVYRMVFIPFKGSRILLQSVDVRRRLEYSSFMVVKGDETSLARLLPDHDNILVSETFALRHAIKQGDTLVLATPEGPVRFGVAAVIVDFSYEFGSILMDTRTYQKHWGDRLVDVILVNAKQGNDISAIRDKILEKYGSMRLFILSMEEFHNNGHKVIDQIFQVFHAMDIVTLSIACFGIVVTLLSSVLERTREIGITRSIGALKNQIARVVVLESLLLGFVGGIIGILSGSFVGWMGVEGLVNGEAGMSVLYRIDYAAILKAIVLALGFSALAGLYPAWRAAKTNIVEALAYE